MEAPGSPVCHVIRSLVSLARSMPFLAAASAMNSAYDGVQPSTVIGYVSSASSRCSVESPPTGYTRQPRSCAAWKPLQ